MFWSCASACLGLFECFVLGRVLLFCYQIGDAVTGGGWGALFVACLPWASSLRASCTLLIPRIWLHLRWVSWQFLRLSGEPPLALGMISSTSALIGWGRHPVQVVRGHLL